MDDYPNRRRRCYASGDIGGRRMGRLSWRSGLLTLAVLALVISFALGQGLGPVQPGPGRAALGQTNAPPQALAPALPMVSGSFADPQGRFQIGILDGYKVSQAGAAPLFQAPDGGLAYTVVIAPLSPEPPGTEIGAEPVTENTLVAVAQKAFGQGEGFLTSGLQPIPGGGIQIDWTGRLTQGATPAQPITGKIFARQRGREVFLLLVAATDAGATQLADAITTLGSTLTVP
ncbi:MAG: hypothetical protein HC922_00710 [Leptolyngbyaceae cyanobacterium SM2_3_12]|nr:hypothetical protein [Leptolyngbyaceae cyanobacterium SM2_3_12]